MVVFVFVDVVSVVDLPLDIFLLSLLLVGIVETQMLIVVVFLALAEMYSASKYSANRYAPLVRNTYSNICPNPELQNGIIRIKLRGKFLRFDCDKDFTLVGAKYVLCKNGRWNSPAPICVKPGCSDLPKVSNGSVFYENEKAAATLYCNSGFKTFGPMYSYCNGTDWDRKIGSCRSSELTIERSCDFESEDLCGWENTAVNTVEWARSSGVVSRRLLKTGPKHDHTTGEPLNGHFMMVDSSQQNTNATAHLISPVYSSNYSTKACFRFFYHMFGDVGTLSVYVKSRPLELEDMLNQVAQFSISGNQGNVWNEGFFNLPKQPDSFQIVIQATLGKRYKSDTAIDDVALLNGSDCQSNGTVIIPITESVEDIFKIDSCVNRCGMYLSFFEEDASNLIHCGCTHDCDPCCPDYAEVCLFDESNGTEDDMVTLTDHTTEWPKMDYSLLVHKTNSYHNEESSTTVTMGVLGAFVLIISLVLVMVYYRADCGVNFISWLKHRDAADSDGCVTVSDEVKYLAINDEIGSNSEECQGVNSMQLG